MEGLTSRKLLLNGIGQIFEGDKRKLDNALAGEGWRYVLAGICIFPITILKVIFFMFENKHLFHRHKEVVKSFEDFGGIGLSMSELKKHADYMYLSKVKDYNREIFKESKKSKISSKGKKEETLVQLQSIFTSNPYLKGELLRVTRHKVKDEDLLESAETGKLTATFITQRVTFGEDMNTALKTVIPSLKLRKIKGGDSTYLVFENDEVFELEQKLRNLFMLPVTISVRKKE